MLSCVSVNCYTKTIYFLFGFKKHYFWLENIDEVILFEQVDEEVDSAEVGKFDKVCFCLF